MGRPGTVSEGEIEKPNESRRDDTGSPAHLSRPCFRWNNCQQEKSMPELPEVETIARGLANRVTGDVIESVWLGQKKEPLKSPASEIAATLVHSRIVAVRRIGKHIAFD